MYSTAQEQAHTSVMLKEVLHYLSPKSNEIYVDGTFGAGGYSKAILEAANCNLYAIDQDPDVKIFAEAMSKQFPKRFFFLSGPFSDMENLLAEQGINMVDGIVLDLGVSSMQLDTADRGFSFMKDADLDMRMSKDGKDAKDLINNAAEEELANIIYNYGGEKLSRRIAKKIVIERQKKPITRTLELANIVRSVVGYNNKSKIDPSTRTFQAIRIWVNSELEQLQTALEAALNILKVGGRLVIVTFHSLEDKIVKEFLNNHSGKVTNLYRHLPIQPLSEIKPNFSILTKNAVKPTDSEISANPRARSAKLRAATKV